MSLRLSIPPVVVSPFIVPPLVIPPTAVASVVVSVAVSSAVKVSVGVPFSVIVSPAVFVAGTTPATSVIIVSTIARVIWTRVIRTLV